MSTILSFNSINPVLKLSTHLKHPKAIVKFAPSLTLFGLVSKKVIKQIEIVLNNILDLPIFITFFIQKQSSNECLIWISSISPKSFFFYSLLDLYKLFLWNRFYTKGCSISNLFMTLINFTTPKIILNNNEI